MEKVRAFLKGKKTYITAAIGVFGAVLAWADGSINGVGLAGALWAAAQTIFIRAGVDNAVKQSQ